MISLWHDRLTAGGGNVIAENGRYVAPSIINFK